MKFIALDRRRRGELKHEQQPGYVGRKLYRLFELKRASWSGGCLSLVSTTGLDQTTERERLAMLFSVNLFFQACCRKAERGCCFLISIRGCGFYEAPSLSNPCSFVARGGHKRPDVPRRD